MKQKLILLFILLTLAYNGLRDKSQYAVSIMPTVLYNTEDIFQAYKMVDGELIAKDKSGLVREIEAQTFPGTSWKINRAINVNGVDVYEAQTNEYWDTPDDWYFYIDSRAVKLVTGKPSPRKLVLPSKATMLRRLDQIRKQTEEELIPYIWGGNILEGIDENIALYGSACEFSKLNRNDQKQFLLQGLDCTGLLYYITDGYTPRNSSWLRTFGDGLKIEDKNIDEVIAMTKPLDIVVHQGHIFIVLDKESTIESRLSKGGGVVITPIKERFEEVFATKVPLNHAPQGSSESSWFVIRRFAE
jgi:hypothetical protein